MQDLIIDTSRYASEKKFIFSETSISTPHSSTSTMSTSLPPDASSEVGSDSVSPVPDVAVKTENAPSPPLDSLQESVSPTSSTPSRKHLAPAERSSTEDHKKVRVSERSKTGCFTCRRRKKKCDETKPSCMFQTPSETLSANLHKAITVPKQTMCVANVLKRIIGLTLSSGLRRVSLSKAVQRQLASRQPGERRRWLRCAI
jgi:hypothetical protein